MRKKTFNKLLECLYPGFIITEYRVLDRHKLDENNKWVEDKPALFVTIASASNNKELLGDVLKQNNEIGEDLSYLTGYNIVID
jgi:hypothetical protein